jgi:hypothetical protein
LEGLRGENYDIFYGHLKYFTDHLVHFELVWYIFYGFGIMYQEKSGNPGDETWPMWHFYLSQVWSTMTVWRQLLNYGLIFDDIVRSQLRYICSIRIQDI